MKKDQNKSINWMIKSQYNSFTDTEKRIADFFINNTDKLDFSAKSIYEKLYVSNASLSRFAQKCGFKGYREFIYRYEESLQEEENNEANEKEVFADVYQRVLARFYEMVDVVQISRVVKYLSEAERTYVLGKGSSGFAASEMELRFMRIGVDIDAVVDPDRMKIQTVFIDKRKLVLGISVSGKSTDVLDTLKEAHKRGGRTVLITANISQTFEEYCDEVLLLPKIGELNGENALSPQIPILLMIDLLYLYFFEQDRIAREDLHSKTMWAVLKNNEPMGEQEK